MKRKRRQVVKHESTTRSSPVSTSSLSTASSWPYLLQDDIAFLSRSSQKRSTKKKVDKSEQLIHNKRNDERYQETVDSNSDNVTTIMIEKVRQARKRVRLAAPKKKKDQTKPLTIAPLGSDNKTPRTSNCVLDRQTAATLDSMLHATFSTRDNSKDSNTDTPILNDGNDRDSKTLSAIDTMIALATTFDKENNHNSRNGSPVFNITVKQDSALSPLDKILLQRVASKIDIYNNTPIHGVKSGKGVKSVKGKMVLSKLSPLEIASELDYQKKKLHSRSLPENCSLSNVSAIPIGQSKSKPPSTLTNSKDDDEDEDMELATSDVSLTFSTPGNNVELKTAKPVLKNDDRKRSSQHSNKSTDFKLPVTPQRTPERTIVTRSVSASKRREIQPLVSDFASLMQPTALQVTNKLAMLDDEKPKAFEHILHPYNSSNTTDTSRKASTNTKKRTNSKNSDKGSASKSYDKLVYKESDLIKAEPSQSENEPKSNSSGLEATERVISRSKTYSKHFSHDPDKAIEITQEIPSSLNMQKNDESFQSAANQYSTRKSQPSFVNLVQEKSKKQEKLGRRISRGSSHIDNKEAQKIDKNKSENVDKVSEFCKEANHVTNESEKTTKDQVDASSSHCVTTPEVVPITQPFSPRKLHKLSKMVPDNHDVVAAMLASAAASDASPLVQIPSIVLRRNSFTSVDGSEVTFEELERDDDEILSTTTFAGDENSPCIKSITADTFSETKAEDHLDDTSLVLTANLFRKNSHSKNGIDPFDLKTNKDSNSVANITRLLSTDFEIEAAAKTTEDFGNSLTNHDEAVYASTPDSSLRLTDTIENSNVNLNETKSITSPTSNKDVTRSVPMWTADRANRLNKIFEFTLNDGTRYQHPPLPPGWTLRISRSRNEPYYCHPDFGRTFYPPVLLPSDDGKIRGILQPCTSVTTGSGRCFDLGIESPIGSTAEDSVFSTCDISSVDHDEVQQLASTTNSTPLAMSVEDATIELASLSNNTTPLSCQPEAKYLTLEQRGLSKQLCPNNEISSYQIHGDDVELYGHQDSTDRNERNELFANTTQSVETASNDSQIGVSTSKPDSEKSSLSLKTSQNEETKTSFFRHRKLSPEQQFGSVSATQSPTSLRSAGRNKLPKSSQNDFDDTPQYLFMSSDFDSCSNRDDNITTQYENDAAIESSDLYSSPCSANISNLHPTDRSKDSPKISRNVELNAAGYETPNENNTTHSLVEDLERTNYNASPSLECCFKGSPNINTKIQIPSMVLTLTESPTFPVEDVGVSNVDQHERSTENYILEKLEDDPLISENIAVNAQQKLPRSDDSVSNLLVENDCDSFVDGDNCSLHSWGNQSKTSTLSRTSTMSHRAMYPPMPLCSLQRIESLPLHVKKRQRVPPKSKNTKHKIKQRNTRRKNRVGKLSLTHVSALEICQ